MKISWFVLFVILLFYLTCPAQAEQLTGRDIAVKMDAVDTSLDSKRTAIMVTLKMVFLSMPLTII